MWLSLDEALTKMKILSDSISKMRIYHPLQNVSVLCHPVPLS